jgi:transcriptional regulator with XRE-family HTH domain
MPYTEFQRLIGKAGLSIKEFAELLGIKPNSITNYSKQGVVPTHIAVIVALISTMKDEGLDFYPVFEKVKSYSKRLKLSFLIVLNCE